MSEHHKVSSVGRPVLLMLGVLLVAANLRAPITGVAPLLGQLEAVFLLSPAEAGLLTTLPLLAFGIIPPFAVMLARSYGLEHSLLIALALIVLGIALRSAGPEWCLYAGTMLVGASIAVGNVLLPSLIKRDFAARVPVVTGFAAITMGAAAALASASIVPLASAYGWRLSLGSVVILPLLALVVRGAQLGEQAQPSREAAAPPPAGLVWKSALAWQVTLFMAINSFLYYVLISWLPAILTTSGYSASAAGSIHGVMQLASAAPGLVLGAIIVRMRDQKLAAASIGILMGVSLAGLNFQPAWATLWAALFGMGSGSGLLLSLIFMSMRASSASQTAALSAMAQGVGYLLAATGPTLAGLLHDRLGSWSVPLMLGVVLSAVMAILGLFAGRSRVIGPALCKPAHQ